MSNHCIDILNLRFVSSSLSVYSPSCLELTGFKEYTVDLRKKQVIIKGDVSFLWSTKDEAS